MSQVLKQLVGMGWGCIILGFLVGACGSSHCPGFPLISFFVKVLLVTLQNSLF